MSITPEQRLWQSVLFKAFLDALSPDPLGPENKKYAREAKAWLDRAGKDFRQVCELAGMCPDFISDKYRAGAISYADLKARQELDA